MGGFAGVPGLLAGFLLRTTIVLMLALLAVAAAKRRPAAFRHFILSAALIGLLFLPLLTLAPVGWRSPLLPSWMSGPVRAAAIEIPTAGIPPAADIAGGGQIGVPGASVGMTIVAGPAPESSSGEAISAVAGSLEGSPIRGAAGGAPGLLRESGPRGLGLLLAVLWAAGLAALLLRLAVGLAGAVRLTAEGTPLEGPGWRALFDRFLALVSLGRDVRLKSHPEVLVPLTWGWRKPVVLLPDGAGDWTEDERSAALWHELSHVKRADFLVMLLVRAGLALFWWNPLCWVAHRELLKEQEIACDDLVLRAGIRPSAYAASLLAFRRSAGLRWNPSAALLGIVGKSPFQDRLAAILKQKITFMEVKMKTKIMVGLVLIAALALIGTARPAAGPEVMDGTKTVLAETAVPAAGPLLPVLEAQAVAQATAEKAGAQEKQAEQEKAKAAEKAKTFVIKPTVVEGKPLTIVITEGDTVKTLTLDKPLTLTKSKDGGTIVLTVDGQDVQVLKGGPLKIEIKGGEVQVLREGHPLNIREGLPIHIAEKAGEEGRTIIFYGTEPEVAIAKIKHGEKIAVDEVAPEIFVKVRKDQKEGEKWVEAKPGEATHAVKIVKEGEPTIAWTIKEGDKAGEVRFTKRPHVTVGVHEPGKAVAFSAITDREMLEKVHALQEQVAAIKAKKMDIAALEESLKKLEAELKIDHAPGEFTVIHKSGEPAEGKSFAWVPAGHKDTAKVMIISDGDKDGGIKMIFTGHGGEAGQAAFERAVVKLKKELPAGCEIAEHKYDAEDGTMTFRISMPKDKKADETLVKKLVELVQSEIKK